jgi:hypothetical protein
MELRQKAALLKDVLALDSIKTPKILLDVLKLIGSQLGS